MINYNFIFPGQGSQFVGMSRDILISNRSKTLFNETSDLIGYDLLDICLNGPEDLLIKTKNTQPSVFTLSILIDQILKEDLQKTVKDILKLTKISAIVVTHDPNEAFYLGDKCGIIINNVLKQFDTPYNIYHFPNSLEVVNFLKRGTLLNVKIINRQILKHKSLGIINGKYGCSNLNHFNEGKTVKLLIQPEDLLHDDKSQLKLKIVDRKFRGTNFIYTLKTPEEELIPVLVDSHHQHLHENNEEFGIKTPINIDHLVCFEKK